MMGVFWDTRKNVRIAIENQHTRIMGIDLPNAFGQTPLTHGTWCASPKTMRMTPSR